MTTVQLAPPTAIRSRLADRIRAHPFAAYVVLA